MKHTQQETEDSRESNKNNRKQQHLPPYVETPGQDYTASIGQSSYAGNFGKKKPLNLNPQGR